MSSAQLLPSMRFVLELGFLEAASFAECTGLGTETKILEYREGGRNRSALKFPDVGAATNVVLKRGMITGTGSDTLFRWHDDVTTGTFENANVRPANPDEDIDQRITIVLRNEAGEDVTRWRLVRALPVKWVGPDLKAAASEVAVETLELAHEGLELE